MKRVNQGYIYVAVSQTDSDWNWVAIKTNKEGRWMSTFGDKEEHLPFQKRLQQFAKWIGNVADYRMVSYGHETYHRFFSDIERYHSAVFSRHLVRMMKAQLWNVKSECMYRFQIKDDVSIHDLLFLYQQDPLKHPKPLMEEAINVLTLTQLFLFDSSQTKKLMKSEKGEVLREAYERYSIDELLVLFLNQGYQFQIHRFNEKEMFLTLSQENVIKEAIGEDLHSLLILMAVELLPHKK